MGILTMPRRAEETYNNARYASDAQLVRMYASVFDSVNANPTRENLDDFALIRVQAIERGINVDKELMKLLANHRTERRVEEAHRPH